MQLKDLIPMEPLLRRKISPQQMTQFIILLVSRDDRFKRERLEMKTGLCAFMQTVIVF
jgi:hypothetical protein